MPPSTSSIPPPATSLATVASGTVDDAIACVDAAAAAAADWAATAPRKRSEILRRTYELMVERADDLALLISAENGKALPDARGEVLYSAEFFRWYAEEAVRIRGDIQVAPGGTNKIIVLHQPVGIAVLVTPWNFPAAMAARKIAPALAAGCTTILKPASETPLTALAIAALMEEAGVPPGVVNVLPSQQSGKVVSAMLADPRVRKLSFTGSTEVGRTLLNQANEHIVNASMELGGNAPFVVFDDADLDAVVEGAMIAKMRNGGEACTAANRFFVQDGIVDAFTERLTVAMSGTHRGAGLRRGHHARATGQCQVPRQGRCPGRTGAQFGGRPEDRWNGAGRSRLLLPTDCADRVSPRTRRSCRPRSSDPSPRSSHSTPRRRRSLWPTTPSTAWCPTSTPPIWPVDCE